MVARHHQLNGDELEQAPIDGDGQASLMYCIPWGCNESDMIECVKNSNSNHRNYSLLMAWPSEKFVLHSLTDVIGTMVRRASSVGGG